MAPGHRNRPQPLSTDHVLPLGDTTASPCTSGRSLHTAGSSGGSTSRRGRGPTRGKGSERIRVKAGVNRLPVWIKEGKNAPVGPNASSFVAEIGLQIRNHAPIKDVKYWKEISEAEKEVVRARVFTKYEVQDYDNNAEVRAAVERKFQSRYKGWRNTMYKHYQSSLEAEIDPLSSPVHPLTPEVWKWTIEHVYENVRFQKRSETNKQNRANLPYNHTMGSRSFPAAMHALADPETQQEPHIIDFFKTSHYNNEKRAWVSDNCITIHEELVRVREESTQEGATPMTQEEIAATVLGKRSGYMRGFGTGPKPSSSSRCTMTAAERRECEILRGLVDTQQEEITTLKDKQERQLEDMNQLKEKQANMERQMEAMLQFVTKVTRTDLGRQGGEYTC